MKTNLQILQTKEMHTHKMHYANLAQTILHISSTYIGVPFLRPHKRRLVQQNHDLHINSYKFKLKRCLQLMSIGIWKPHSKPSKYSDLLKILTEFTIVTVSKRVCVCFFALCIMK